MQLSTLTVPTLALALAATLRPADSLAFAPAEKTTVAKTFETETKLESTAMRLLVDGESQETGEVKISIFETGIVHVTDEYVKVGKGRPVKLKRTFDKLEGKSSQVISGEGDEGEGEGDKNKKKDKTSKLEGQTVVFTWDDKKAEYAAAYDEGKGDADLLTELHEDLDLRMFLPEEKVAEGASWDLDAKAFQVLLSPGGNLHLEAAKDEDEDKSDELDKELLENLAGKSQGTYKGTREVGGKKLSVIAIKAELKTHGDQDREKRGKMDLEIDMEVEGELLWDTSLGHAVSLTLSGTQKAAVKISMEFNAGGESHSVRQEADLEGTTKLESRFKTP